jgi:hypothetical protein
VHGLLSNVFGIQLVSLGTHESFNYKTGDMATLPDVIFPSLIIYFLWCGDSNVDVASIIRNGARDLQSNKLLSDISDLAPEVDCWFIADIFFHAFGARLWLNERNQN